MALLNDLRAASAATNFNGLLAFQRVLCGCTIVSSYHLFSNAAGRWRALACKRVVAVTAPCQRTMLA